MVKQLHNIAFLVSVSVFIFIHTNAFSQIYINEIMVNPAGSNDGSNMPNTSEWVEFYNSSASAVNISCWYFY